MKKNIVIFINLLIMSSCVPLKKSIYLQGELAKELDRIESAYNPEKTSYLIKPNDNLYIRVTSLDSRTSAFLNNDVGSTNNTIDNPMAASLIGYRVELDGSINYPFVGKIYVANLTLDQVRDKIQLAVSKFIEESSVNVKLLNDNITIIGEVTNPGRFLLYAEEVNLLEAISMAGDLTDFANRKKVRLIRQDGETQQMIVINTLDEKIMFSPYYYLKPGDIIYVEPRRLKSLNLSQIPIGMTLTLLNTVLLMYTFYQTQFINNANN
ncbi:polysaccharide biosynthesis/export family protein [Carboxylicivirga caseinilyticus]|uniref:polysaccharide biosynthesis/export family protein n=1 Tax=Carboxylicivirga caseinilyticus TaxID=3417572 RepID=UPI002AA82EB7|nr:polysaccharide biosynthesis/export family protein [uncultured Carboxylicivirga sp.]MCU4165008.1 polysaccharide biosynthesis/export family protein [Marinilabiliaceae bacterium A049]